MHAWERLLRLNGWRRLWILLSVLWIVVIGFSAVESYKAQRWTIVEAGKNIPIVKTDNLGAIERFLVDDDLSTISVNRVQQNVVSGELRAQLDGNWVPAMHRTDMTHVLLTIFGKSLVLWILSILAVYVSGVAISWVAHGFKQQTSSTKSKD